MRSWEQAGLDPGRTMAFVSVVGVSFFALVVLVGGMLQLGAVSALLGGLTGGAAAYLVSSAPKRLVSRITFQQTLEAPTFAASSGIYLRSTSSRSKTFLMLSAEEPLLKSFLATMRRGILTGYDAAAVMRDKRIENTVISDSVKTILNSVVSVDRGNIESGTDELDGILNSMSLDEETKMPLLMAASFFLPIMLMLFSSMTRNTGPVAVVALVVLEIVILDIVLSISRSSGGWAPPGRREA